MIDDEPALLESLSFALRRSGFESTGVTTLREGRNLLDAKRADLIVLDLMLPDGDGFTLLESLRSESTRPPVIVLSSRAGEADRVRALDAGADDYVTKPFSPREMVARVRAVLRRAEEGKVMTTTSKLMLDEKARRASVLGQALDLTRVEFDIVLLLDREPGHVFSRASIIDAVWGSGFALSDRTIDSHIKALRRKIADAGGDPNWIETVRGVGYRMSDGMLTS